MQIHLQNLDGFDKEEVRTFLKESGSDVQMEEGPSEEAYVNYNCWTESSVLPIWQQIQRLFRERPALQNAAIVCCTGQFGWDDYLLLHGATEGETLDELKE